MGRGKYMGEILSLSGIFKIAEFILIFSALMVHRKGDGGKYVFFGTTDIYLTPTDDGVDVENLGNGTLVAFAIISPVLLICYVLDGRYSIQRLFLETVWNFVGAALFIATGVKTIIVWHAAQATNTTTNSAINYATRYSAGLALGSICLILGVIYFVDFCISWSARNRIKGDEY